MNSTHQIEEVFEAVQTGDAAKLKEILHSNPTLANMENSDGHTPLGYAAHLGHANVAAVLLEFGADVNAISHSKVSYIPSNTALHAAIAGKRNLDVIKLLLSQSAQTRILDSNGHTCLHTAAFHDDNVEIIRLLIEHGADVQAHAEGGVTALTLATEQGNHQVAELLREYGA
ncbi:ankyrin repeat domain-containing protein [Paenibacillus sp. N1-5-1-14]|uniref:ankyrin repeat domain-containing protein n=1 Tax=Paenibacillus radicibacter TaxID=2972488 RepID=UPI002158A91D|nr:ankyrin repeat domain-containing protein [Paenibacillus radicibacter]MCR8644615.1 ankyrin repeat domain-containing protein [Paenibacillus radicibacter]